MGMGMDGALNVKIATLAYPELGQKASNRAESYQPGLGGCFYPWAPFSALKMQGSLLGDLLEIAILGFQRKTAKIDFSPLCQGFLLSEPCGQLQSTWNRFQSKNNPKLPPQGQKSFKSRDFHFYPWLEAYFQASDFMISAQA